MKTVEKATVAISPYTLQNIDVAITHLEKILCAEGADSLFAQAYWRGRILEAYATPWLMLSQRQRLQRLLEQLARANGDIDPAAQDSALSGYQVPIAPARGRHPPISATAFGSLAMKQGQSLQY